MIMSEHTESITKIKSKNKYSHSLGKSVIVIVIKKRLSKTKPIALMFLAIPPYVCACVCVSNGSYSSPFFIVEFKLSVL